MPVHIPGMPSEGPRFTHALGLVRGALAIPRGIKAQYEPVVRQLARERLNSLTEAEKELLHDGRPNEAIHPKGGRMGSNEEQRRHTIYFLQDVGENFEGRAHGHMQSSPAGRPVRLLRPVG